MASLHVHSKSGKCGNKQMKIEPITNIFNYCTLFCSKGTFNRYVTLKGGRGLIHFVTERYWRGREVQVIPLRNADKISQLVFIWMLKGWLSLMLHL